MEHTSELITRCEALLEEQGINTDHFPIHISLDLNMKIAPMTAVKNFCDIDWKEFRATLEGKVAAWGIPNFIKNQVALDRECDRLMKALQETIKEKVPSTVLGSLAKRWWTKELDKLRTDMLDTHRKACKT